MKKVSDVALKLLRADIDSISGYSYEAARSIVHRLTFGEAQEIFSSRKSAFGKSQMRTLHLIGEDGSYTNLAFLLSDECTHSIKLALFDGNKRTVFRDRVEVAGSLFDADRKGLQLY